MDARILQAQDMWGERDTGQAGCINSYVMINVFTGVAILSFIKIFAFFFCLWKALCAWSCSCCTKPQEPGF